LRDPNVKTEIRDGRSKTATALINHVDHIAATVREIEPPSRKPPLLKLRRDKNAEMVRRWREKNAEID
jgi:hypothetical protein